MLEREAPDGSEVWPHQWFNFRDENGWGAAQADVFLVLPDRVVLFECKLTENPKAFTQMVNLYSPLLRRIFRKPITRIQVCKNLRAGLRRVEVSSLEEAVSAPLERTFTWHWLP